MPSTKALRVTRTRTEYPPRIQDGTELTTGGAPGPAGPAGAVGPAGPPGTPGTAPPYLESDITNLVADLGTLTTAVAARELLANKNAASGYAGLSAGSKLTGSQQAYGAVANTAAEGNDARLSDARTPTAHAASHKSGGADAIKLDELAAPTNVTTLDATIAQHGLLPKLPNVATQFLNGVGAWAVPPTIGDVVGPAGAVSGNVALFDTATGKLLKDGGAPEWDVAIRKSANQDVTNSTVLVDDTELKFPVVNGEIWWVEIQLAYSGDATGDYKFDFTLPTVFGWERHVGMSTTAASTIVVTTPTRLSGAVALAASVALGAGATLADSYPTFIELFFRAGATTNFVFRFANSTAGAGIVSRTWAGSRLRAKKIL